MKERRVEITLRGVRFTDHPKNPLALRGVEVAWERVGGGNERGLLFNEDGSRLWPRGMPLVLGEVDQRLARRARDRRWRQLIEDGAFDVTDRLEWVRKEQISMGIMLGVFLPVMVWCSVFLWGRARPRIGETLPGFEWIEWVVVMGIISMPVMFIATVAFMSWSFLRIRAREVRVTAECIEVKWAKGGRRWAWSELRSVRRSERVSVLRFSDGSKLALPHGRVRPVIQWQQDRLHPPPDRVAWGFPIGLVMLGIVSGVLAAWVSRDTPEWRAEVSAAMVYGAVVLHAALLAGVMWRYRWVELRAARRRRPRRV